jgi:hypothetical protein
VDAIAASEPVAQPSDVVAEANNESASAEEPESEAVHAVAGSEPTSEPADDSSEPVSRPIVDAVAETYDIPEAQEAIPSSPQALAEESVDAHSESAEPAFAESELPPAAGISMKTPESPESSTEPEGFETEHEISDEILAQLAQGIEIEVSADSLAALSSSEVPAEESPAQFYSSDAEPERQPIPAAENAADQQPSEDSDSTTEPEKSRKAAAGE